MGVPVLAIDGNRPAARQSALHLATVGLEDFITGSIGEYEAKALEIATNPEGLAALREGMRVKMATSGLCDHEVMAEDLTRALRKMWHAFAKE